MTNAIAPIKYFPFLILRQIRKCILDPDVTREVLILLKFFNDMIISNFTDSHSIGLENHTRTSKDRSTVHFYNIGIDGNNTIRKGETQGDWIMRKFSTIYAELDGHGRQVRRRFVENNCLSRKCKVFYGPFGQDQDRSWRYPLPPTGPDQALHSLHCGQYASCVMQEYFLVCWIISNVLSEIYS